MSFFKDLNDRGIVAQVTHPDELGPLLDTPGLTAYAGFDPTADSLTAGHLVPLLNLVRIQRAGHRPIALMGGGTTLIGDPTGKTEMRRMLTRETIAANATRFKEQMSRVLDFGEGGALMVDNGEWLESLNYIQMLREVGAHFSVNRMLSAECFKSRMESGLSFLEFNYMILQSYDFLILSDRYGCKLQVGGDDQWSNILAGADLIRRLRQRPAYALTFQLLTTADGRKMGKTEKGALWLDAEKTSPYEFYQYFRNVPDDRVGLCLGFFTLLPADEVTRLGAAKGSEINSVKEVLAWEVTRIVHGEDEANKAKAAARAAFGGGGGDRDQLPTTLYARSEIPEGGLPLLDILIRAELASGRGDGRRLVAGGGIRLNGVKVEDPAQLILAEHLADEGIELRKGKTFHRVKLS